MVGTRDTAGFPHRRSSACFPDKPLFAKSGRMEQQWCQRAAKVLRLYCPIEADTLAAMLTGDATAIDRDPSLAKILRIIRDDNPLGDFGIYKSVVELAPGWELFTPAESARPTLGKAWSSSTSPTAILTIYFDADASAPAVSRALSQIIAEHPWEVPVIEMNDTVLLARTQ